MASDGVGELNQACVASGCVPGDAAGWPIELTASGSYRLTSNLEVPDLATTGILVGASRVTIELNGFGILGPGSCNSSSCSSGSGNGISPDNPTLSELTVRNGFVHGVGGTGLVLPFLSHVEGVTISEVGGSGIQALGGSVVLGNRVAATGASGMDLDAFIATSTPLPSLYRDNVVRNTGLRIGGVAIVGGTASGGNLCGDGSCSPRGTRRFYLSLNQVQGGDALTACEPGFHMASLWEIRDTASLHYDVSRGVVGDGQGAPGPDFNFSGNNLNEGWIRGTGDVFGGSLNTGEADCLRWTTSSSDENGSLVSLSRTWINGAQDSSIAPFRGGGAACDAAKRVWCIED